MQQRTLSVLTTTALIALSIACAKSKALTPTTPTVSPTNPPGGATLKVTAPAVQSPANNVRLETFTAPTLTSGSASPTEGGAITPQYRFQLLSDSGAVLQDSGLRSATNWTPTYEMEFDKQYQWQVRAEFAGDAGPWSARATFRSPDGGFIRGKAVFDPLTNGRTVGTRVGGHFEPGANGGWQSDSQGDAIFYDIDTCDACRVEFDVTNFGTGEGASAQVDVKWFSMGSRAAWIGFTPFRDHPWKMHLEQRSDGDGTGMQLIWRNGAADADTGGDPDIGDHRGKFLSGGPDWGHSFDNKVWHFMIQWTRLDYRITINQVGQPERQWFPGVGGDSGYFGGGQAYAPPGHRLELGCSQRVESMVGARYRNFKVTPL